MKPRTVPQGGTARVSPIRHPQVTDDCDQEMAHVWSIAARRYICRRRSPPHRRSSTPASLECAGFTDVFVGRAQSVFHRGARAVTHTTRESRLDRFHHYYVRAPSQRYCAAGNHRHGVKRMIREAIRVAVTVFAVGGSMDTDQERGLSGGTGSMYGKRANPFVIVVLVSLLLRTNSRDASRNGW